MLKIGIAEKQRADMNSRLLILVAAALWLATAGMARAQQLMAAPQVAGWMAYRNDSLVQVLVQASSMGPNNQERRGPPHLINPREAAADQVFGAGPKTITVYDAKGSRVLGRVSVNFVGKDLFFSVGVEFDKNKQPIKATLTPVPDPRTNPGGFPGMAGGMPGVGMPAVRPPGTMPLNPVPGVPVIVPGLPRQPLPK
jgi:hypothetical protein